MWEPFISLPSNFPCFFLLKGNQDYNVHAIKSIVSKDNPNYNISWTTILVGELQYLDL
jgi:hypothetical protein